MLFHELFQANFSKFTLFSFLVIACASYSKYIKLLQFHEFVDSYFSWVFAIWTNCALPPISKAILNSTRNQLSTVGHFAPSI